MEKDSTYSKIEKLRESIRTPAMPSMAKVNWKDSNDEGTKGVEEDYKNMQSRSNSWSIFKSFGRVLCMTPTETNLEASLKQARRELATLRKENKAKEEKVSNLSDENKVAQKKIKDLLDANKQLNSEMKNLKIEKENLQNEIESLKKQNRILENEKENRGVVDIEKAKEVGASIVGTGASMVGTGAGKIVGTGASIVGTGADLIGRGAGLVGRGAEYVKEITKKKQET